MENERAAPMEGSEILVATHLRKYFPIRRGFNPLRREKAKFIHAVEDVSLTVPRGKTLAILGESGCGKTTLARALTLLSPPSSGEIVFDQKRIVNGSKSKVNRKQ